MARARPRDGYQLIGTFDFCFGSWKLAARNSVKT